jgi:hypothetical protein
MGHVAGAHQHVPQWSGEAEVGVDSVVMDVMIRRRASGEGLMKAVVVEHEVAQPIDDIANSYRTCKQERAARS